MAKWCRFVGGGWIFPIALLLVSAACETPIENRNFSEITFAHLPPILLEVAEIEVNIAYQPPSKPPNVEQDFPVSPIIVAERWVKDRLQAVGKSGRARVTIVEASVVEVSLKKSSGLKGLFTTDQSERYDARVALIVEAVDLNRQVSAQAQAEARRSRTVSEGITLAEREKIWFSLTESLMADFNGAMEAQIAQHMISFLK